MLKTNKLLRLTAGFVLGVTLFSQFALAANGINTYSITLSKSSSQYLSRADTASLSITGDMTLEVWLKVTSLPGSGVGAPILFKGDYNTNNAYQLMYLNDAGTPKIHGRIFAGAGNANIADSKFTYTLTTGTWIHVAMIIKPADPTATKFELCINGTSQGNGTASLTGTVASIYDNTVAFTVGQSSPVVGVTDYYLDSKVDEVRVWNVAKTCAQVAASYQTQLAGNEANLQAYWQLNNALTDLTANANTLTNNGAAAFTTDVPFTGADTSPTTFGFFRFFKRF